MNEDQNQMNFNQENENGQNNMNQDNMNQNYGTQQNYQQPQQNYNYQYNNGWDGQPYQGPYYNQNQQPVQHGKVTDVFCNILLVLFIVQIIEAMFMIHSMFSANTMQSFVTGDIAASSTGAMAVFSLLNIVVSIAMIVFLVLDIVKVYKANYKITGMILFAIFLKPGYYIWRAYVLGRKKAFPIIYTVVFSLLYLAYFILSFFDMFQMFAQITY